MKHHILSESVYVTNIDFAGVVTPMGSPRINRFQSHCHVFSLSFSSTIEYCFDNGKILICPPGTLIYLPKGCTFSVKVIDRQYSGCIAFQTSDDTAVNEPFCVAVSDRAAMEKLFRTAAGAWADPRPGCKSQVLSCLYEIMYSLISEYNVEGVSSNHLKQVDETLQYILSNYTREDIPVEKLVAMTDIGESYYRRIFKQKYGTSPTKYVQYLRIGYAKQIISTTKCSVDEIAHAVGYSSASYFCRQFKQITGMTPKEYRAEAVLSAE